MIRFSFLLCFITPGIYLISLLIVVGQGDIFLVFIFFLAFLAVGLISLFACAPYYNYPEPIRKYCVLGSSIGVNLMFIISMINASKTIVFAEGYYVETLFIAIVPYVLNFVVLRRKIEINPKLFILISMGMSIVSMIPIFLDITEEIYLPTGG